VEAVVPAGREPRFSKFIDLNMLVMTGGRERTEAEFRELYQQAEFRLMRIILHRIAIQRDRRRACLASFLIQLGPAAPVLKAGSLVGG